MRHAHFQFLERQLLIHTIVVMSAFLSFVGCRHPESREQPSAGCSAPSIVSTITAFLVILYHSRLSRSHEVLSLQWILRLNQVLQTLSLVLFPDMSASWIGSETFWIIIWRMAPELTEMVSGEFIF